MHYSLGLGILSWGGGETLKHSLNTYHERDLFSFFQEKVIFLPEQKEFETKIAQDFKLSIFGSKENLGILNGFKALAESLTSDIILLLENDCPLIEDTQEVQRQLAYATQLLHTNQVDIVRLRHRIHAGQDWSVVRKYREYYPDSSASFLQKLYLSCKRLLRPHKAEKLKGWSIYAPESSKKTLFPNEVDYSQEHDSYLTNSAYLPWTNQSILIKRDFFLNTIINYAVNAKTTRRINQFKNLEIEMNSHFWRGGNFKIAIPRGLFTHQRIGDRGYRIQ
jgi:hypothetical protein